MEELGIKYDVTDVGHGLSVFQDTGHVEYQVVLDRKFKTERGSQEQGLEHGPCYLTRPDRAIERGRCCCSDCGFYFNFRRIYFISWFIRVYG